MRNFIKLVLMGAATTLSIAGCSDTPVASVSLKKSDPIVILQGKLPDNTQLDISAGYISSTCTERNLVFPGGDIVHPEWRTENTRSGISKMLPGQSLVRDYKVELPAGAVGRCQWQLDEIKMKFTPIAAFQVNGEKKYLAYRYTFMDQLRHTYSSSPNVSSDTDFVFTPQIYTLNTERSFNGEMKCEVLLANSDNKSSEWYRAGDVEERINFRQNKNITITLSPTLKSDYQVGIVTKAESDNSGKRYSIKMDYPDGTTYFSSNSPVFLAPNGAIVTDKPTQMYLYSPDRPESKMASLARSGKPEAKRILATVYELGHAVPQDKQKAHSLYLSAAQGGDIPAMEWMKKQAEYQQSKSQIAYWRDKLASAGSDEAQFEKARSDLCWQRNVSAAEATLARLARDNTSAAAKFLPFWQNASPEDRDGWFYDCRFYDAHMKP